MLSRCPCCLEEAGLEEAGLEVLGLDSDTDYPKQQEEIALEKVALEEHPGPTGCPSFFAALTQCICRVRWLALGGCERDGIRRAVAGARLTYPGRSHACRWVCWLHERREGEEGGRRRREEGGDREEGKMTEEV